ncbi:ribosomal RNA-processing protein 8-like isoform X1 [Musa acuminata AAA Group]|uniref:ribosomal RNA-processing protein 8-like isoform X1 n=1 Tax=Musa acuminata AAA Group TaxID=214697 RepID=UPI0031D03EF0
MTDGGKPDNPSRKRRRKRHKPQSRSESANSPPPQLPLPHPKRRKIEGPSTSKNQLGFLQKMRMRLSGGHFRMLNEKLYTCSGSEAFNLFKNEPELFDVVFFFCSIGYQEQMVHWPEQPVNAIAKWLRNQSSLKVADFGCGNATLAKSVKNKVFSIDLVSNDPSVIACDMAHTPLDSSSVDVAVFCLSLMGTNYSNYLQEAKRVLKPSGWLLIAEVRSRFDPNTGGADPEKFFEAVSQLGFSLVSKDFSNKMFVLLYFKKAKKDSQVESIKWPELKPCIYKRR